MFEAIWNTNLNSESTFLSNTLFVIAEQSVTAQQLLIALAVLLIGYLLIRWGGKTILKRMTAKAVNPDLIQLISRMFHILGFVVLGITILELLHVPLTAFAFISGAVAIGLGFGAQNIISNFISGWILMWERPIRIGDFLEIQDTRGTVESINTRSTRIRRIDGVHLLVPNSYLLDNIVVNWTLVDRLIRSVIRIGVAYGSPVERVSQLILEAVTEHKDILGDPKPVVIFEDFGDNALLFDVYFWVDATAERDQRVIRSDVRFRISALFAEADIVIAYPQRDVHLDGELRLLNASEPTLKAK